MAPKIFKKFFSRDFIGLDGQSAAIEEDLGVNRALNYEMSIGNSIRGRVGCQIAGGTGNFFGIFPYRYSRTQVESKIVYQTASGTYPNQTGNLTTLDTTADGASIQKLIAVNQQAWVLDTMSITVTYVSGTYPFTWYSYVNGSNINFVIKANGVSILDTSLGDGISSSTTIYSLLGTIDALAELSVSRTTRGTCPPFAIVNGNQASVSGATTTYGVRKTITVNAGHNFAAGDIITFPPASFSGFINSENFVGGVVISTTATTITYVGPTVNILNNAVLGYMGQPATGFPIDVAQSASSGNLTISFPYWRLIPEGDARLAAGVSVYGEPLVDSQNNWATRTADSFFAPPVAENSLGCLYIASSASVSAGISGYANNLVKIDGAHLVRAGLPQVDITATANATAGVLTGTFKYKGHLRRVDKQGNIIDGIISPAVSATPAANNNIVGFRAFRYASDPSTAPYTIASGFAQRSAFKNTTEAPNAGQFFYVDDNSAAPGLQAFIQPGDTICLLDNTTPLSGGGGANPGLWLSTGPGTTGLGALHRTYCTDYCAQAATISPTVSSIRVADSSGYTITDNSPISTGDTVVIYRTTAGGNQYYKLCEIPYNGYSTSYLFNDNVNDSVLTSQEQLVEPVLGKEHNPPPPCTLVCQHQGGLVVARGPTTPNTVAVSTADGIEYFPTASNSFDVPSTQVGSITAIASDTDDRLAVFKKRAYYDVVGDIDGGAFTIAIRNEGDYGITSQASLVRASDKLIGLCENGFITVRDGLLDPFTFKDLNARLVNQSYYFDIAVAVNDSVNRQYICSIPTSSTPVSFVIDYSRETLKTFDRSYSSNVAQAGGMALVNNTLYHLCQSSPYGVFKRLPRFDGNSPSGNGDGDSFIDNTGAITYIFESAPIHFGEPGQLKSPIRIRIWSIPNDYVIEGWVPFSLLVEAGASPLAQYVGSANPMGTTSTVTFSAETDVFKDVKLVKGKGHFYILRFTTSTIRTAPFTTGYEIMFADNYEKEDFAK